MRGDLRDERANEKILSAKESLTYMVLISLSMVMGAVLGGLCSLFLEKKLFLLFAIIGGGCSGIFFIYFFLKYKKGFTWAELGFKAPKHKLVHLFWQIPLAFAGSLMFAGLVGKLLDISPAEKSAPLEHSLLDGAGLGLWLIVAAYFLSGVILIPIVEEIVFRKLLTDLTAKRFGLAFSIVLNSIIFALAHIAPMVMPYIFPLGLALNILYRRYDSLWASFALHAFNNIFVFVIVFWAMVC